MSHPGPSLLPAPFPAAASRVLIRTPRTRRPQASTLHTAKERVKGRRHSRTPLRPVLAWGLGLRKEGSQPRPPRESARGVPGAPHPGTSVSPSASGSHRDTRATPPVPGPPGRRPHRHPRPLAATCEAAIGHIPLGFPSCAWCRCPTATLGGPTEGPSALRRAHRHMETRRCCWQFLGVIRQRGTVLSAPRAFTCFIPGTTY